MKIQLGIWLSILSMCAAGCSSSGPAQTDSGLDRAIADIAPRPDGLADVPTGLADLPADAARRRDQGSDGPLVIGDIFYCAEGWQRVAYFGTTKDIWGTSGGEIFAVGRFGLARYDGARWKNLHPNPLEQLWGTSGTDVYALGDKELVRYDGTKVTVIDTSEIGQGTQWSFNDVWASGPNDIWVVGSRFFRPILESETVAFHWNGSKWSDHKLAGDQYKHTPIWGSGKSDVVVVAGTKAHHFNGSQWQPLQGNVEGNDLWGTGPPPNRSLVAVNKAIWRHDGLLWLRPLVFDVELNAIWGNSAEDIYTVGDQGLILHFDGPEMRLLGSPTFKDLHAVWQSPSGALYVAGDEGIFLRDTTGCPQGADLGLPTDGSVADGGTTVPSLTVDWATSAGGPYGDVSFALSVDAAGNTYLRGQFSKELSIGSITLTSRSVAGFVAKLDDSGAPVWAKVVTEHTPTGNPRISSMAVDTAGNLHFAGTFTGTVPFGSTTLVQPGFSRAAFVAKINADGTYLWAKASSGHDGSQRTGIFFEPAIAVDSAGTSYLSGGFAAPFGFGNKTLAAPTVGDLFMIKLDDSGTAQWASALGMKPGSGGVHGIAIDKAGNAIVAGSLVLPRNPTWPDAGDNYDIVVAKVGSSGALVWSKLGGGPGDDFVAGLAIDADDNILIAGRVEGPQATFGKHSVRAWGKDILVAKLDAKGTYLWASNAGSVGLDLASGVSVDKAGNAYVAAVFKYTVQFGSTTLNYAGRPVLAKVDPQGRFLFALETHAFEPPAIGKSGHGYLAGSFKDTLTLGTTTLQSRGSDDIFISKVTLP